MEFRRVLFRSRILSCDDRLECRLQAGENRRAGVGRAQVERSQLRHERIPHRRAAFFEELRADRQFLGDRIVTPAPRSEERRVGKEGVRQCRSWWSPDHTKKKTYRIIFKL